MSYDQNNSAKRVALRDISEELDLMHGWGKNRTYVVGSMYLDTKETRRLNRELGITKLNYFGNKNGIKEKD